MSSIKRYMEDKAEKLSEAMGMEYDDALTMIMESSITAPEDTSVKIKALAKEYNTTYDDIYEYVLLAMALKPTFAGRPIHPVDYVSMVLKETRGDQNDDDKR